MADQLQLRGGTTAQTATFTGALREVTVDTDKDTLVVHDNALAGGYPLMRENGSNAALALASAATPSLKFTGDTNTGVFSPGADQIAISTGGTSRLAVSTTAVSSTLAVDVPLGAVGTPSLAFTGDLNTGVFSPGADTLALVTAGTNRLHITSAGLVGIGTSAPKIELQAGASGGIQAANALELAIRYNLYNSSGDKYIQASNKASSIVMNSDGDFIFYNTNTASTAADSAVTGLAARMTIKASGNVGIGTTSPGSFGFFAVRASAALGGSYGNVSAHFSDGATTSLYIKHAAGELGYFTDGAIAQTFYTSSTERARLDASGRLLVGTSSSTGDPLFVVHGRTGSATEPGTMALRRGGTILADYNLGQLDFTDGSNNVAARISGTAETGWGGSSDAPGRLVFSTTADGASSPTEHLRINEKGTFHFSNSGSYNSAGGSYNEIYNTNNTVCLYARNTHSTTPLGYQIYYDTAANNTGSEFLYCSDVNAQRAAIRSNGGFANYQANNVNLSDRNAKKDINPAAGTWDCIKEWEIVNYRYKDQPDDADLNLGVIAQQVAESCPEVITVFEEAKDDQPEKLGIKEQQMMWMAIKALQEAQVRIEQLETSNADLLARVSALESA